MKKKRWLWMLALVAVLSGACGDADSEVDSGGGDDIPVDTDASDDDVSTEPMCVEGEPDCGDISSGMPVDGGLTILEALATEATGTLAVRGYGFVEGDVSRLCESLAPGGERYECGGASVVVQALDLDATGATVVFHDGLAYTDEEITVFGELVDGVLVLDPLVG